MDAITLASQIQHAIAVDANVLAYCNSEFSARPHIFVGVDDENPPDKTKYPVVALFDFFVSGGGASNSNIVYEMSVGCGVINDAIEYDADLKTTLYRGLVQAETLRSTVFAALKTARLGKITIKDGAVGQVMVFPMFVAGMTVAIETINLRTR